jgi:integrase/recombinase XerD
MERSHKREPLTQDEMNSLANACKSSREKMVIWTLLDSGVRVDELCNLKSIDIDWQRHTFVVYGKNTTGDGGKKKRPVVMSTRCIPLLESWFAVNQKFDMSTRTANNLVHRVANRVPIRRPCSPHVLRHSFAVTSLRKGISLTALMKMMGHEDIRTTKIYLNMQSEDAIREYLEKW